MTIDFNKTDKYFEINFLNEEKPHSLLLDLYFNPAKILGDYFEKIFPRDIEYQKNHALIPYTVDFIEWNGWLFRGHKDAGWKLETSFERLIHNRTIFKNDFEIETDRTKFRDYFEIEMGMIREFRRKVFEYAPHLKSLREEDYYEWIANMQHYGCKTRFLDVTFSFFVALYFAVESIEFSKVNEDSKKGMFTIWFFNRMWIEKRYKDFLPREIMDLYNKYDQFGKDVRIQDKVLNYVPDLKKQKKEFKDAFKTVINMTPYYLNERLVRQKGSFLVPTNPYCSFEENLFNMIKDRNDIFRIIKVNVEYNDKSLLYMLKFLDEMNNTSSVLFNSIEGLCKNINYKSLLPNDSIIISPNKGIKS